MTVGGEFEENLVSQLARCADGDRQAFTSLYKATSPKLFSITLKMVRDEQLAQDILQDAYVSIWKRADKFDPSKGKAFTWILVIARNSAIDVLRRQKRHAYSEDVSENIADENANVDAGAKAFMLRRLLEPHMKSLPDHIVQVLELKTVLGMNSREIGEVMDVPTNTVKSWSRRALKKLRKALPEEDLSKFI